MSVDRIKAMAKVGRELAFSAVGSDSPDGFLADTSAQMSAADRAVNVVVGLMVGGLVAAFLLPVAIDEIVGVDTSSWGSGASSLWDIMDVIIVLAVFLFFVGIALKYK